MIEDEEEKWVDNIGKVVRFKVKNRSDETHWLEGRIDGYVIIKDFRHQGTPLQSAAELTVEGHREESAGHAQQSQRDGIPPAVGPKLPAGRFSCRRRYRQR